MLFLLCTCVEKDTCGREDAASIFESETFAHVALEWSSLTPVKLKR
jgi:hypothetical protein